MMFKIVATFFILSSVATVWAQNAEIPVATGEPVEFPAEAMDEVLVEANVVEIVLNDEHRDGVDWGAIVSDFHTVPLKKENNPIWVDKKYRLSVGTVSDEDYEVLLEALDTVGHVRQLLQSPFKVNSKEVVDELLRSDIRVQLQVYRGKGGVLGLNVEPHLSLINNDARNAQQLSDMLALKAQTGVALNGSATIVIGGIFKEEEITKTHKFPLLGDLPLVGLVFRSRGRLMQKTETVIFLRTRINLAQEDLEKGKGNAD